MTTLGELNGNLRILAQSMGESIENLACIWPDAG
ncbi:hypothetical protein BX257_0338 [Streptomyces sp. 3212.3]|nr:hypothetical protein BX257_0338 [Streptomyces sp. 3212.3]